MKSYFLPLGSGAEQGLSAMLTALSCGAAPQPSSVFMLRVPVSASGSWAGGLWADVQSCHRLLAGKDEFAFFRTEWETSVWVPALPERDALVGTEESRLLLQALRGDGVPFSFRTDREAAEWSMSALLEEVPEEADAPCPENLKPFVSLLSRIRADLESGEDVRIMLLCDLAEGYASGLALALLRFLRSRFADQAPFLGLIGQARFSGAGAEEGALRLRETLSALSGRNLVRLSEDRGTDGADACWLVGLPASFLSEKDGFRLLDWASARILGDACSAASRPSFGLHTREIPGILTLQSLDTEAKPAAAFLRGTFWCLSDLFPALRSYLDHPALLRSLAPASRGGLFRRLFREENAASARELLTAVDRTLRALSLEILSLLNSLPPLLRESDVSTSLWQDAVNVCGRAVTLASEYDVRRQEAEDAGVDKVQPVHRVSLSDTEEEQQIRKLDAMAEEVHSVLARREEVFQKIGGYASRMALEDCLSKCLAAETSAREKLIAMPAASPEERYSLGLQERRIRLLQAAVARCRQDLQAARKWDVLSRSGSLRPGSPFAGEILDPDLAGQALLLLTSEGEAAETASKNLRDGLDHLLRGYPLNDAKMLLKNLLSVCRQPETEVPLRSLLLSVYSVCGVEVSGLRFRSSGQLPAVPLLPDLAEEGRFFTMSSAPDRILAPSVVDQSAEKRGLLALMILRQYRRRSPGDASLELLPIRAETSVLSRVYLSSRGVREAWLCVLREEREEGAASSRVLPLAVLLPGTGLEPARLQASCLDLIPSFVLWLDRENLHFQDPCTCLSEGDRQILTEQLTRLRVALNAPRSSAFSDFLSSWHHDIMQAPRQQDSPEDLRRRLRIICGLYRLPIWQKDLRKISTFYESSLKMDPVCAGLCGKDSFEAASCKVLEDAVYVFRGTPLARENALRMLDGVQTPEEAHYLSSLDTECDILLHSSDDYHEALAAGLQEFLRRFPGAGPEAVGTAESLLKEAQEPVTERVTELIWPWDTFSSSVLTILTECLGKDLASAALHAFSDRLALFPARGGEILGDTLLNGLCLLPREIPDGPAPESGSGERPADSSAEAGGTENAGNAPPQARPDAVLPPLSPDFARIMCRLPQGQSLLQPGLLRFSAEGSSVRAELTLEGAFTLKLVRVYSPDEIQVFYAHDLPSLALWPSLPFAPEDWHMYVSYAHTAADFRFVSVSRTEETELTGSLPRFSACQQEFPLCYLVYFGGTPLGAVPNLLPAPVIQPGSAWTACMDFGTSASSIIFTDGAARWPMQGPVTVRSLLRSPAATDDLLWREFLPAVPVSALIPGALRIFRNDLAEQDLPLRDGAVFMSSTLRDVLDVTPEALYTDLKWSGEKGRAFRLYLHQIMLMAALQARCGGASQLSWRVAMPEEMAEEGRDRLAEAFRVLAEAVSRESGLPLPEKEPPVAFVSESSALGAYFRLCSPEQTRGGFLALDQGAGTADLSLFLRGREEAVRSLQLPLGLHNMLFPSLLRRPEILWEDFGFVEQDAFRQDLQSLQALLEKAKRDPAALRQARYALDAILTDYFPLFLEALSRRRAEGQPGLTGALFLLHECFLMMLTGLMLLQIAGDSTRNDDLPESMTLFLAGRGSLLTESLSLQSKTSLWKMLTMFRNTRVSSLNLMFSAEKKFEIPVGLSLWSRPSAAPPRPAAVPAAIAVRPEELIPEFLLRFRKEFPGEAALLFPGVYANDYYAPFTPYGQQLLIQALQAAFERREAGKPFPALVACLSDLLEMIQEGGLHP